MSLKIVASGYVVVSPRAGPGLIKRREMNIFV